MIHPIKAGRNVRMSYSKIEEVLDVPNLIEVQKKSYTNFLEEGLREVFRDVSPIMDFAENLMLEFIDYKLDDTPKYSVEECKERDATYAAALRVRVRLTNRQTGEIKEQDIFMGDFPLMTVNGTFVINGAERVIVSQLVRSPGVYFTFDHDRTGKKLFANQVIPNRGAWLEYETDSNDVMYVRIDRTRKLPLTVLIRALGYGTDQQIIDLFGEEENITATIQKDNAKNMDEGLLEIYKRLRPGEPPTVDSARTLINNLFFDPKRYDLAKFGRFKFNKKLALATRIAGQITADDIADRESGEVFVSAGEIITRQKAWEIQDSGINEVRVLVEGIPVKIIGNHTVSLSKYVNFDPQELGILERVHYPSLVDLLEGLGTDEEKKIAIRGHIEKLVPKHILQEDILASINYMIGLVHGIGSTDDIDHLGNRRLRSVGELLQNQFRIGLTRLERVVRERMTIQDMDIVTPQALINIRPVAAAIKEFFGSSQLSQFMDQPNPLAELTHKRRLSALGPGGLSRERAGFEVRDVHYSHYGRMCPIETPEGP
ncbi:MAG TPA: DNA-directed RNA polymerase subunit beta, partial [Clostridiales bacterium]|nr:DNA-directed RNA polymerase subunit beta [Clostridiales bacterium]